MRCFSARRYPPSQVCLTLLEVLNQSLITERDKPGADGATHLADQSWRQHISRRPTEGHTNRRHRSPISRPITDQDVQLKTASPSAAFAGRRDHRQRVVSESDATSPYGLIYTGTSLHFSGTQ
jgi:hypothetical protein